MTIIVGFSLSFRTFYYSYFKKQLFTDIGIKIVI